MLRESNEKIRIFSLLARLMARLLLPLAVGATMAKIFGGKGSGRGRCSECGKSCEFDKPDKSGKCEKCLECVECIYRLCGISRNLVFGVLGYLRET